MPLVATRGAASAQGFGEFAQSAPATYIEDVFSTYLFNTSASNQNIINGINLATYGGLTWIKSRSNVFDNILQTSAGSVNNALLSNSTSQAVDGYFRIADLSNGFTLGTDYYTGTVQTTVSWTFRKQPKFFDVVTYTGNGSNRTISHNLGSVPGSIFIKRTDTTGAWAVYHRSLANTEYLVLNTTTAKATGATYWNSTTPTSTEFSLGTATDVNANSGTYVAYLFAHNAGGFGTSGSDNVISCGSFTCDGFGNADVTLGYEPQWLLVKPYDASGYPWYMADIMRGMPLTGDTRFLLANTSGAETGDGGVATFRPTATGFQVRSFSQANIYIAIRRGPMKTPTSGTSVYNAITRTGTGTAQTITSIGFPPDLLDNQATAVSTFTGFFDRLRGGGNLLYRALSDPETTVTGQTTQFNTTMSGFAVGASTSGNSGNNNGVSYVWHAFRRAPGFFDEVCYTGTGSNTTVTHNLGVAPELVILKRRNSAEDWPVLQANIPTQATLNGTFSGDPPNSSYFGNGTSYVAPTSTVFSVGTNSAVNASGGTYVAYLFASCPGVSKVGSYTGTGATQTISCGFAARFVLIKRTDSVGNWWVWDTARGMVTGTDPRLAWDTTNSQFNNDWVFTDASGFQIVTTDATVNASGGTYIFLAIA